MSQQAPRDGNLARLGGAGRGFPWVPAPYHAALALVIDETMLAPRRCA